MAATSRLSHTVRRASGHYICRCPNYQVFFLKLFCVKSPQRRGEKLQTNYLPSNCCGNPVQFPDQVFSPISVTALSLSLSLSGVFCVFRSRPTDYTYVPPLDGAVRQVGILVVGNHPVLDACVQFILSDLIIPTCRGRPSHHTAHVRRRERYIAQHIYKLRVCGQDVFVVVVRVGHLTAVQAGHRFAISCVNPPIHIRVHLVQVIRIEYSTLDIHLESVLFTTYMTQFPISI